MAMPSVPRTAESASVTNVAPLHATTGQECVTASRESLDGCATSVRKATRVSPAVKAAGGATVGQLPSGPPAILSPTAVHVARGLEVVTASAVSQDTGIIALLAARSVTVRVASVICIQEDAWQSLQRSTCATSLVISVSGI